MSEPNAEATPEEGRNPWIWVSALLAVVAVGLLVWGLNTRSDLDQATTDAETAQRELASTKKELDATEQKLKTATQDLEELKVEEAKETKRRAVLTAGTLATVKRLYGEMSDQLDATEKDLAATQEDLEATNDKAAEAEKAVATAKRKAEEADDAIDKAKAEADQARAEAEVAASKSKVFTDCARAYVSTFGALFEGDDVQSQVPAVRDDISAITAECQGALSG